MRDIDYLKLEKVYLRTKITAFNENEVLLKYIFFFILSSQSFNPSHRLDQNFIIRIRDTIITRRSLSNVGELCSPDSMFCKPACGLHKNLVHIKSSETIKILSHRTMGLALIFVCMIFMFILTFLREPDESVNNPWVPTTQKSLLGCRLSNFVFLAISKTKYFF